ncbi:uncharacterized protein LOC119659421 isoform X2 [Hermetia illucens]|uniref:uncharacterized protein LOC119659421 isoform X2 n=1 Tax=Hermetia illucens TaxID=343691 RepID=UPI0018CC3F6F|nr:uncharacterized protein LOC119659421 isoform X2 [Hermetia illucens]
MFKDNCSACEEVKKCRFGIFSVIKLTALACKMSSGHFISALALYVLWFACVGLCSDNMSSDANEIHQSGKERRQRGNGSSVGWTNINKEVDMALQMIWPIMVQKGYTSIELPDMTESLSVFVYDYKLAVIGFQVRGKVGGAVQDTILAADFSISVEDANIRLNNFQIISFGNIDIQLKYIPIMRELSSSILRPITDLFKDRIITIVAEAVRIKLEKLIDDINENDRLHFKEFGRITLSGLIGEYKG